LPTEPHFPAVHALVFGVQPHTPGVPPPPHVLDPVHAGHGRVPPHPLLTEPQLPPEHAEAWVFGVQPQTFGLDGVPPPHVLTPLQVPQNTPGQVPWAWVPQSSPAGHVVGHVLTHRPLASHAWFAPHVPQEMVPPHPSGWVPHFIAPVHVASGVQPHTFGTPPPPQVVPDPQVQVTEPPHPSAKTPHLPPAHTFVFGVHPQTPAAPPPPHVFVPEQLQLTVPPQPSPSMPHLPPPQGLMGVQPHTFATPAPPHVLGAAHVPHATAAPQLLVPLPHVLFAQAVALSGTQAHRVVGVPVQVSLAAHAVQTAGSPHP
jgi:hypothetical protein